MELCRCPAGMIPALRKDWGCPDTWEGGSGYVTP